LFSKIENHLDYTVAMYRGGGIIKMFCGGGKVSIWSTGACMAREHQILSHTCWSGPDARGSVAAEFLFLR
jgi:hypothetical protein